MSVASIEPANPAPGDIQTANRELPTIQLYKNKGYHPIAQLGEYHLLHPRGSAKSLWQTSVILGSDWYDNIIRVLDPARGSEKERDSLMAYLSEIHLVDRSTPWHKVSFVVWEENDRGQAHQLQRVLVVRDLDAGEALDETARLAGVPASKQARQLRWIRSWEAMNRGAKAALELMMRYDPSLRKLKKFKQVKGKDKCSNFSHYVDWFLKISRDIEALGGEDKLSDTDKNLPQYKVYFAVKQIPDEARMFGDACCAWLGRNTWWRNMIQHPKITAHEAWGALRHHLTRELQLANSQVEDGVDQLADVMVKLAHRFGAEAAFSRSI